MLFPSNGRAISPPMSLSACVDPAAGVVFSPFAKEFPMFFAGLSSFIHHWFFVLNGLVPFAALALCRFISALENLAKNGR